MITDTTTAGEQQKFNQQVCKDGTGEVGCEAPLRCENRKVTTLVGILAAIGQGPHRPCAARITV